MWLELSEIDWWVLLATPTVKRSWSWPRLDQRFLNFFSYPPFVSHFDTGASLNLKIKHKKQNNNLFAFALLFNNMSLPYSHTLAPLQTFHANQLKNLGTRWCDQFSHLAWSHHGVGRTELSEVVKTVRHFEFSWASWPCDRSEKKNVWQL